MRETVTIVVTHESSGFDKYSQELAKRLGVKEFHTKRYFTGDQEEELRARFRALEGPVHITNQNFARYAALIQGPYIVTVHDLIRNFHNFDGETPDEKEQLKLDLEGLRGAKYLISVSETTKKEIISRLDIPPEKIFVIHNGVDHSILSPNGVPTPLHAPYILAVGAERPRKNLDHLVEAIAEIQQRSREVLFVKVGGIGRDESYADGWRSRADALDVSILYTGRVSEEELARWYRGALMLVFPSRMEGFGLPIIEAMACGCPVVASAIPSSKEILGDAGILVDPESAEDIARGIREMLFKRNEYIQRGLVRAKFFSWDIAVEQVRRVYALLD